MDKIIGVLGAGVPSLFGRFDDDFADRLSHVYTSAILVVFAVVVSTKQLVGDAINCWVPAHFTGNHEEYTNNFCWVRNTYLLPFDEQVPDDDLDSSRRMLSYYQWVPLILLVEALLFHLPISVWRLATGHSGIYIRNLVDCGRTLVDTGLSERRDTMLQFMTLQVDRFLSNLRARNERTADSNRRPSCCDSVRRRGNHLLVTYLGVKLIFVINAVAQLFALNVFLGQEYYLYGIQAIRDALTGRDWTASGRFPRVTMCDLRVRRLGTIQRYTVQCVLPINLFNEKIFLFLWFWIAFVAAASLWSLIAWVIRAVVEGDRVRYVRKHLLLMNRIGAARRADQLGDGETSFGDVDGERRQVQANEEADAERGRVKRFVKEYLMQDGVFVLRLIGHNTNAVTVTELACSLWDNYCAKRLNGDRLDGGTVPPPPRNGDKGNRGGKEKEKLGV